MKAGYTTMIDTEMQLLQWADKGYPSPKSLDPMSKSCSLFFYNINGVPDSEFLPQGQKTTIF